MKDATMSDKAVKTPGPDHPIVLAPSPTRVKVTVGGRVVAESVAAISLREASYPPVLYIPREDVDIAALERSAKRSHCPYKGECTYYSVPAGGPRAVDAVWTYEDPFPAAAAIRGYVAFYPDRVDAIEVTPL